MILHPYDFTSATRPARVTRNYITASPSNRPPHSDIYTNNTSFSLSILLLEEWPLCILPSATIIFFGNNDQRFLSIEDIYISKQHADGHPLVSPANYGTGDLLFDRL